MSKKQVIPTQEDIDFFIEHAKMLSLSYEEQCAKIADFAKWNLASDMANDWTHGDLDKLNQLFGKQLINERAISLHDKINKNFDNISYGGLLFEEVIWEHEGLKKHPFWEEQRRLAKELLAELEKIQL